MRKKASSPFFFRLRLFFVRFESLFRGLGLVRSLQRLPGLRDRSGPLAADQRGLSPCSSSQVCADAHSYNTADILLFVIPTVKSHFKTVLFPNTE